ncbi:MAG: hypothetical protein AAF203_00050 [Pseudomonadota bacterium]
MQRLILLLLLPTASMAGLKFPSDRLKVMDIETLQRIVATNLTGAQNAINKRVNLEDDDRVYADQGQAAYTREDGARLIRESVELIFARPEQNNATSAIYSNVEGVAVDYGGIFVFLENITNRAIETLDESGNKKTLLRDQNTYVYILNNMMAEIKPIALSEEGTKYRKLIEKIRDEDIDFSDSLKSYRVLNSMSNITNPSKVAATIVGKKKCGWWEFLWC